MWEGGGLLWVMTNDAMSPLCICIGILSVFVFVFVYVFVFQ